TVRDAVKLKAPEGLPTPAAIRAAAEAAPQVEAPVEGATE
ncbi:MAG: 50S ribosomal protein L3, partial [Rubrimonas sp.]